MFDISSHSLRTLEPQPVSAPFCAPGACVMYQKASSVVSVSCQIHTLLLVGHQSNMPGLHILLSMSAQSQLIEYVIASV